MGKKRGEGEEKRRKERWKKGEDRKEVYKKYIFKRTSVR